jgi:hypothetical protein
MSITISCHDGTIYIDTNSVRVLSPFKKLLWSALHTEVTGITRHQCMLLCAFTIHATHSSYTAHTVVRREAEQLMALFPGLVTDESTTGQKWYLDPHKNTYQALYSDHSAFQEELRSAQLYGWIPQVVDSSLPMPDERATNTLFNRLRFHLERHHNKDGVITVKFVRKPYWHHQ